MPSWVMAALTNAGHKQTTVRKKITAWLEKHKGIFSVQYILDTFPRLDKVSVYRTIDLLAELDLIHPITTLGGVQYYELHGKSHHHHTICTSCQKTACIGCHVPKIRVPGFRDIHHTFILTGLCKRCA